MAQQSCPALQHKQHKRCPVCLLVVDITCDHAKHWHTHTHRDPKLVLTRMHSTCMYMYCFACMALLVTRRYNTCPPFSSFFQVDQPNFWDQVYKVQTERDIYEWYGLGPLLISVLSLVSLVSLERIAWSSSNCPKQIQDKWVCLKIVYP